MTETTQRLFVAVIPPEHVLEHLDELVAPMRVSRPDLHWVAPRRMHVTVAFMPHVPEVLADRVPDAVLAAARDLAPVRLRLAGSGHFDEHVLWCGVSSVGGSGGSAEADDELSEVSARIVSAVTTVGASPERRPFRPHLSLARAASRLEANLGGLAAQVDAYEGPVWLADELVLVHSHVGRAPHHEVVAVVPLGG